MGYHPRLIGRAKLARERPRFATADAFTVDFDDRHDAATGAGDEGFVYYGEIVYVRRDNVSHHERLTLTGNLKIVLDNCFGGG